MIAVSSEFEKYKEGFANDLMECFLWEKMKFDIQEERERAGLLPKVPQGDHPAWTRPRRGHWGSGSPWMGVVVHGGHQGRHKDRKGEHTG